jgi:hypothetical protein
MVNHTKPPSKKRNCLSVTIPQHIIDEIDHLPSKCNRSEKTEVLLKAGLYYNKVKREMEREE